MVQQAAGRRDQDVQTLLQGAFLGAVFHAAEDHRDPEAQVGAVGLEAVGDLGRQFARGAQDQGARGARRGRGAVLGQAVQDRQGEGGGLAGAGLGDAQQVLAGHDVGDGFLLDRRGLGIAGRGQSLEKGLVQAHGFEGDAHSNVFRVRQGAFSHGMTPSGRAPPVPTEPRHEACGVDRAPPRVSGQRMNLRNRRLLQSGPKRTHTRWRRRRSRVCDAAQMGAYRR